MEHQCTKEKTLDTRNWPSHLALESPRKKGNLCLATPSGSSWRQPFLVQKQKASWSNPTMVSGMTRWCLVAWMRPRTVSCVLERTGWNAVKLCPNTGLGQRAGQLPLTKLPTCLCQALGWCFQSIPSINYFTIPQGIITSTLQVRKQGLKGSAQVSVASKFGARSIWHGSLWLLIQLRCPPGLSWYTRAQWAGCSLPPLEPPLLLVSLHFFPSQGGR